MRHYAHNIGDYAAATRHLSLIEDGAYRRLLDRYYQDEKPLPADPAAVCRLIGAKTGPEKAAVRRVLEEFFKSDGREYRQKRADIEIATYKEKVTIARANGTKGGRPPVKSGNQQETNPVSENKLTTNHYPLDSKEDGESSSSMPRAREDFEEPVGADAEDDAPPPVPAFLARQGVKPPRAMHIDRDWLPSEDAQARLVKSRPDLSPERIVERTSEFVNWCLEGNRTSHNPDATWLKFMEKTHVKRSDADDLGSSPTSRAIDAAFARRSVSTR